MIVALNVEEILQRKVLLDIPDDMAEEERYAFADGLYYGQKIVLTDTDLKEVNLSISQLTADEMEDELDTYKYPSAE